MLVDKSAVAMVAVKDLDAARKFYEGTLGLKRVGGQDGEVIVFKSGGSTLNVYRSQYAGTNKATTVMWSVGPELEELARTLKGQGVEFLHYDMPGMTRQGDIHLGGGMKVA